MTVRDSSPASAAAPATQVSRSSAPEPEPARSAAQTGSWKHQTVTYEVLAASSSKAIDIDPLRVKIAVLTDAFGSKSMAAEFLGVARSQPGKWLSGKERPNPRARRLIQDFDYVWDRLTDERSPEIANLWLNSPNSFLGGSTPITWLKTRGPEDVVGAVDAEEAGSFA